MTLKVLNDWANKLQTNQPTNNLTKYILLSADMSKHLYICCNSVDPDQMPCSLASYLEGSTPFAQIYPSKYLR